jgi:hypothetical protein
MVGGAATDPFPARVPNLPAADRRFGPLPRGWTKIP